MDEALIRGLVVDGLKPTHQRRSRALVVRLLNGGRELLRTNDFDSLSVERLCAHTGVTIGSFYARFETKDAFIDALQRLIVEASRAWIAETYAPERIPAYRLELLMPWFVETVLHWYREHEGFVRASLRKAAQDPAAWMPVRELGEIHFKKILPHIGMALDRKKISKNDDTMKFAFQLMYGTLNNMVLINPRPFSIHHSQTSRHLANAMLQVIASSTRPNPLAQRRSAPRPGRPDGNSESKKVRR